MRRAFAPKIVDESWGHFVGTVRARSSGGVRVAAAGSTFGAGRALSCLVEPEPGDRVLVARSGDESEAYVLAVLERGGDAPIRLSSPGDTELRAAGRLSIVATEATLAAPSFSLVSRTVSLHATSLVAVLTSAEVLVDQLVARARRALRVVDELDHLRAGRIDHEAADTMSLHAGNTTITAEGLVKVDGEQIQLG